MKQTLKATAAIIGIVAAVVILNYFMKALGCLLRVQYERGNDAPRGGLTGNFIRIKNFNA